MKTTYGDKEYEVLDIDDAATEVLEQKAKGVYKAIISVPRGYIVVDAVFPEETKGEEEG